MMYYIGEMIFGDRVLLFNQDGMLTLTSLVVLIFGTLSRYFCHKAIVDCSKKQLSVLLFVFSFIGMAASMFCPFQLLLFSSNPSVVTILFVVASSGLYFSIGLFYFIMGSKLPNWTDNTQTDSSVSIIIDTNNTSQSCYKTKKNQWFRILRPYFWPTAGVDSAFINRLRVVCTLVVVFLSKAANITAPIFIGFGVNSLASKEYSTGITYITIFAVLSCSSKVLKECQSIMYIKVQQTAFVEIAEFTFAHMHTLSLQWHFNKRMGNVIRSMDRGCDAANSIMMYLVLNLIPTLVECVSVCIIFLVHFESMPLSLLLLVNLIIYAILTFKVTIWRRSVRTETNKHDNAFHDRATDSLVNYETVKYFCNEGWEQLQYTNSVRQYQKYSMKTQLSLSLLNSAQQIILYETILFSLWYCGYLVTEDRMRIGSFIAVNTYIMNIFVPLNFLGTIYGIVVKSLVDISNLCDLLEEEPDIVDGENVIDLPLAMPESYSTKASPSVEFKNVSFQYPSQSDQRGLDNISFEIRAGTTTAIVGPTGAGKTTISRLLFRFYVPSQGELFIGGHNVRDLSISSIRKSIGVVPQDTIMFNETLRYNLEYGRIGASFDDIKKAAAVAQLSDFIESLPYGWETNVGERGLKLSGGEKQRVAIARCLLKDPPIVILDEATSALDTKTEAAIFKAIQNLSVDRTVLMVAHRLSTVKDADQILVLNEGEVVERGTHEELLEMGGLYSHLWSLQLYEQKDESLSDKESQGTID
eukprot:GHVL01007184.1.p1 GENE.GHVL01007184.1~~GHVL01007184.1.p1  ORF type:complete len:753 (-),score=75.44 GHVL01007184.1:371-2629(-)